MKRTLDELRALCAAATPGPWNSVAVGQIISDAGVSIGSIYADTRFGITEKQAKQNLDFLAASREALPELVAWVAELEAERDQYRDALIDIHYECQGGMCNMTRISRTSHAAIDRAIGA